MSIFLDRVADLMRFEGYGSAEAHEAAKNDLLDSKYADLLKTDPGYLAWAKRQDQLDRKFHEETDR